MKFVPHSVFHSGGYPRVRQGCSWSRWPVLFLRCGLSESPASMSTDLVSLSWSLQTTVVECSRDNKAITWSHLREISMIHVNG